MEDTGKFQFQINLQDMAEALSAKASESAMWETKFNAVVRRCKELETELEESRRKDKVVKDAVSKGNRVNGSKSNGTAPGGDSPEGSPNRAARRRAIHEEVHA
jgi:predicted amidophosphoribosyltransferase